MEQMASLFHTINGLSGLALAAIIILAAFALAGFAIYAVFSVARGVKPQ